MFRGQQVRLHSSGAGLREPVIRVTPRERERQIVPKKARHVSLKITLHVIPLPCSSSLYFEARY